MKSLSIPCAGYELEADLYERPDSDAIVLVLVGYSSTKKNYEKLLPAITEQANVSALVIDLGGHGESPFELPEIRPAQNFLEVVTVFDWLRTKYPDKKLHVMGNSYGGFLAVQLTKYRDFDKLVLRAPAIYRPEDFYTKWKDIDRNTNFQYRNTPELLALHPVLNRASKFGGKTLVVAHENDEVVPRQVTDAYAEKFHTDVYVAKDFPHSFGDMKDRRKIDEYLRYVSEWLKTT